MCGIGDAVWYIPFLQTLRAYFPKAEIVAIVASGEAGAILGSSSNNIEVIVFNRGDKQRGWRPLLSLLRTLRHRRFDVVISGAHPDSVRVPLFAFLCGARRSVGATFERLGFLYNHRVDIHADAHYLDRYRLLLTAVEISMSPDEYRPTLEPPLAASESATRIWNNAGLSGEELVIGMASGADVNSRGTWQPHLKRWNNEGYALVAESVTKELGARVVLFGGPAEAGLAENIVSLSRVPIVNLCGKTGLQELQWLLKKCTVFVGNDTGLMHMAGALGVKVVGLFGPTNPDSFRPPGGRNLIARGRAPCSPCYPHPTCDLKSCRAMNDIPPSQIIKYISDLLESRWDPSDLRGRRFAAPAGDFTQITPLSGSS